MQSKLIVYFENVLLGDELKRSTLFDSIDLNA